MIGVGLVWLGLTLGWAVWGLLVPTVLWRSRTPVRTWDAVGLVALTVVALALRLVAPAVQHDLNPRLGELFAPWADLQWSYTHGLVALFRLVAAVGVPVDDRTVFDGVAVLGALSVALVAGVTAALGGGRVASASAGLALALLGLHVRYSHTDAPQVVEAFLTLFAAWVVLRRRAARPAAELVLVGLSLGLAAAMRPEAIVVPALLLLWARACGVTWSLREAAVVAGLVACVALPDWLGVVFGPGAPIARGAGLDHGHGALTYGLAHFAVWNAAFVPLAIGLLPWLAPWGRAPRQAVVATLLLMIATGALVANDMWSIGATPSWCLARHQLRTLPWMAVLVGLGAEALVDGARSRLPARTGAALAIVVVACVAATTATTLPAAYEPTTLSEEYAFVRAHQGDLPAGCTVVTLWLGGDRGLSLPQGLPSPGNTHTWKGLDAAIDPSVCTVYYRSSLCTAAGPEEPDPGDRCAAFEAAWTSVPVAEASVVARGWLWERYAAPSLRVGYYRLIAPGSAAPPG